MSYHYQFTTKFDWHLQTQWQTPDTPFMHFDFWQALIDAKLIGWRSDWWVQYVQIVDDSAQLIAVMPVFIKKHHQGEYVFDFSWAEAFERYGRNYYPRSVSYTHL